MNKIEFKQKIEKVAGILGAEIKENDFSVTLTIDLIPFCISIDYYKKILSIFGIWPSEAGYTFRPQGSFSIKMSSEKSELAIAKDIKNRFFKDFSEEYKKKFAESKEFLSEKMKTKSEMAEIKSIFYDLKSFSSNDSFYVNDKISLKICETYTDNKEITISNLSTEELKTICYLARSLIIQKEVKNEVV